MGKKLGDPTSFQDCFLGLVRPSVNAEILHEMSQGSWDDLRKDHFAHEFCGAAWCPKNMDRKLVQVVILYDLIFVYFCWKWMQTNSSKLHQKTDKRYNIDMNMSTGLFFENNDI